MWREPGLHVLKLKEKWGFGIWLGRDTQSDAHIIGTRQGVLTARSIRRLAPSERHDKQLLLAMQGKPAKLKASQTFPSIDSPSPIKQNVL